ncbi:MAG: GFA family protein [Gammaproteobacteria bacterium]|nr:GFA family protein [Gammaproteobacteria bacterium]
MKIDGGCHCGYITYQAEVDPNEVVVCHCTDCQTLSGSAFRTVVFGADNAFEFLTGRPKIYIKVAESGNEREQTFCPECGAQIYSTSVGDGPKSLGIRVGTARQRNELRPSTQYWTRSAQKWIMDLGSIKGVEQQ